MLERRKAAKSTVGRHQSKFAKESEMIMGQVGSLKISLKNQAQLAKLSGGGGIKQEIMQQEIREKAVRVI